MAEIGKYILECFIGVSASNWWDLFAPISQFIIINNGTISINLKFYSDQGNNLDYFSGGFLPFAGKASKIIYVLQTVALDLPLSDT